MADVPEALKALARHGIGAAPGYPWPARGNSGSIALVYDPDGNEVELLDRRPLHGGASPSAAFGTDEQPAEVAVGR